VNPADVPAVSAPARALGAVLRETLVVLTRDPVFAAAVRAVAPSEHDLVVVGAEADLATRLMSGSVGVVVLDTAATISSIAPLSQGLKAQFPDLVLVVAGGAAEQAALSAQVTSGDVYRFLHKPASEQRLRLFIDAAWRRRGTSEASGATSTVAQLALPAQGRRLPPGTLAVAAVMVAGAAGIAGWLMGQHAPQETSPPPPPAVALPQLKAPPAVPTDSTLNQLLERAGAALARNDLLLPPGESAADLYHQALERHPGDAQALAGLDKVVDQVLSAAEQDLLAQHLDEAEHLNAAARAIAPQSARVSFLATQIAREKERALRAQAHLQQQQQQADVLEHQQQLIADARAALSAGNLDDAARAIGVAADAGVDKDAVDTLTRDLQGAQLVARMKEALAKSAPAPAAEAPAAPASEAPKPPTAAAPQAQAIPAPQGPPANAGNVVSAATLERLRYVAPEYPARARADGTSGWVDLAFDVEPDGSVTHVAVLGSDPKEIFDAAAVAAVRRWRYQPAERDGHPIEQRAQLRIRFALQ
jgi:protein TonB